MASLNKIISIPLILYNSSVYTDGNYKLKQAQKLQQTFGSQINRSPMDLTRCKRLDSSISAVNVSDRLLVMGGSPGDIGEARKGCRISCEVAEAAEGLKNKL